jgi:hypothetical protein
MRQEAGCLMPQPPDRRPPGPGGGEAEGRPVEPAGRQPADRPVEPPGAQPAEPPDAPAVREVPLGTPASPAEWRRLKEEAHRPSGPTDTTAPCADRPEQGSGDTNDKDE